jgi:uncharacterized protein
MDMLFKETLPKLRELQSLDKEIYGMKNGLIEKPLHFKKLQDTLEAMKSDLARLEEVYQQKQVQRKKREGDLAAQEENVKKYTGQQTQVKTNKEYSALQTEINQLKADNSMLEEEIILLLDEIDNDSKNVDIQKKKLEEEEKKVQTEEAKLKEIEEKLKKEISTLEDKRKELLPQIDRHTLERYQQILKRRSGVALVSVKDGSCGACFCKLPPQVINEIKQGSQFVSCERCTAILYIEE